MKKKSKVVIAVVAALCVLGVGLSYFMEWPVDYDNASGNIAKSSRFSRKTSLEGLSNMQELLASDEAFKSSMVASYVVMNTRAKEFCALVEMSEQVSGDIQEFQPVVKDLMAAKPMVQNVVASMEAAGADLNSALGGEVVKDLAQSSNNAALAYTTLQKQNVLANRYIETADEYLHANGDTDPLILFVRDQWVEYQKMTAALEKDEAAAAALEAKGYCQTPEQSVASLGAFNSFNKEAVIAHSALTNMMGYGSGKDLEIASRIVSSPIAQNLVIAQAAVLEQSAALEQNSALAKSAALVRNSTAVMEQNTSALNQRPQRPDPITQNAAATLGSSFLIAMAAMPSLDQLSAVIAPLANSALMAQSASALANQSDALANQSNALANQNNTLANQNNALNIVPWENVINSVSTCINAIALADMNRIPMF